jgi:hypothetical protein
MTSSDDSDWELMVSIEEQQEASSNPSDKIDISDKPIKLPLTRASASATKTISDRYWRVQAIAEMCTIISEEFCTLGLSYDTIFRVATHFYPRVCVQQPTAIMPLAVEALQHLQSLTEKTSAEHYWKGQHQCELIIRMVEITKEQHAARFDIPVLDSWSKDHAHSLAFVLNITRFLVENPIGEY